MIFGQTYYCHNEPAYLKVYHSAQFKMVSVHSEKPMLSWKLPLKQFQSLIDDGLLSSFQARSSSTSSFHASLLQTIAGVMSLALCPQVVSQASQHFRSSEKQATCEGCFARQSICSVVSLHSGMPRAVHPQKFLKVDVGYRHIPVWASHSTFHFL